MLKPLKFPKLFTKHLLNPYHVPSTILVSLRGTLPHRETLTWDRLPRWRSGFEYHVKGPKCTSVSIVEWKNCLLCLLHGWGKSKSSKLLSTLTAFFSTPLFRIYWITSSGQGSSQEADTHRTQLPIAWCTKKGPGTLFQVPLLPFVTLRR